jgi:hypothetical protein
MTHLIEWINHAADSCIIAIAIFFVVTLIKFSISEKIEKYLSEKLSRKIEYFLELTSILILPTALVWAFLFY